MQKTFFKTIKKKEKPDSFLANKFKADEDFIELILPGIPYLGNAVNLGITRFLEQYYPGCGINYVVFEYANTGLSVWRINRVEYISHLPHPLGVGNNLRGL